MRHSAEAWSGKTSEVPQVMYFTDTSMLFIDTDFKQVRMRLYCRYFV